MIYHSSKNPGDFNNILNSDLAIVTNCMVQPKSTIFTIFLCLLFGSPQKMKKVDNIVELRMMFLRKLVESYKYLGLTLHQHMWTSSVKK